MFFGGSRRLRVQLLKFPLPYVAECSLEDVCFVVSWGVGCRGFALFKLYGTVAERRAHTRSF